jgi:large subunit ribosomal protein L20
MKLAKGYDQGRHRLYRTAKETVIKSRVDRYFGLKRKKRDFRRLWITRLSAAVRAKGLSYSRFIQGLKRAKVEINRKLLSNMAIYDSNAFDKIVALAVQHN